MNPNFPVKTENKFIFSRFEPKNSILTHNFIIFICFNYEKN